MSVISNNDSHALAMIDTSSLTSLVDASTKRHIKSHGWVFSLIDSSFAFSKCIGFASMNLTKHFALAFFSALFIWTESGYNFFSENATRAMIDFVAMPIGLLGVFYPRGAADATARMILFLDRNLLDYKVVVKEELDELEWISSESILANYSHYTNVVRFNQAREALDGNLFREAQKRH